MESRRDLYDALMAGLPDQEQRELSRLIRERNRTLVQERAGQRDAPDTEVDGDVVAASDDGRDVFAVSD